MVMEQFTNNLFWDTDHQQVDIPRACRMQMLFGSALTDDLQRPRRIALVGPAGCGKSVWTGVFSVAAASGGRFRFERRDEDANTSEATTLILTSNTVVDDARMTRDTAVVTLDRAFPLHRLKHRPPFVTNGLLADPATAPFVHHWLQAGRQRWMDPLLLVDTIIRSAAAPLRSSNKTPWSFVLPWLAAKRFAGCERSAVLWISHCRPSTDWASVLGVDWDPAADLRDILHQLLDIVPVEALVGQIIMTY